MTALPSCFGALLQYGDGEDAPEQVEPDVRPDTLAAGGVTLHSRSVTPQRDEAGMQLSDDNDSDDEDYQDEEAEDENAVASGNVCTKRRKRKVSSYSEAQQATIRRRVGSGTRQLAKVDSAANSSAVKQWKRILAVSRGSARVSRPALPPDPEKGGICDLCSERLPVLLEACKLALLTESEKKKLQRKNTTGYHYTRLRYILVRECFDTKRNWLMHSR